MNIEIGCRLEIDSSIAGFIAHTVRRKVLTAKSRPRPEPETLPPLTPGCRRVYFDGSAEREPIGDEPHVIVERKGDFEFVSTPVFKNPDGSFHIVKPRLNGPWEICEGCDVYYPLPDGREQGFWVWIRRASGVRS
jgi:hypothetical protein